MASFDPSRLPSRYWKSYIARAEKRLAGEDGATIREFQALGLLAGVPTELVVAFTAPANQTDNTTEATEGLGTQVAFHEITKYQVPAGIANRDPVTKRSRGKAPNPDPAAKSNTWGRLHDHALVTKALGRPATMVHNAWKKPEFARDQHAVGLVMLMDDYVQTRAAITARAEAAKRAPDERPRAATAPATPWGAAVTFAGFSSGPSGAAAVITTFGPAVAAVSEKARFGALLHHACLGLQAGTWKPGGSAARHSNAAHRLVRTWQKLAFARELCRRTGGKTGFFDVFLGEQQDIHEEMLVRASLGLSVGKLRVAPIDWTGR